MTSEVSTSDINILPNNDFENGLGLGMSFTIGDSVNDIINSSSESVKNSAGTITFELQVDSADQAPTLVQTLEMVKGMAMEMIPGMSQMNGQLFDIEFRHVGSSVFLDISGKNLETLGININEIFSMFNIDLGKSTETVKLNIHSGLTLNNPFEITYDEILQKATQFKVEGHGEMPKKMLEQVVGLLLNLPMLKNLPNFKQISLGVRMIKLLTCFKKFSYNCKYNSEELCIQVGEIIGRITHNTQGGASMDDLSPELGSQIMSSIFSAGQEQFKMTFESLKPMIGGFIEPFAEGLKIVNLDRIAVSVLIPNFKFALQYTLEPKGLTEFIRTNLLN